MRTSTGGDRISHRTSSLLALARSLLFLALGVTALIKPGQDIVVMTTYLGIAAILSGLFDITLHHRIRGQVGHGSSISWISGVISALSGVMLLLNPAIAPWLLTAFVPLWLIAYCLSRIVLFDFSKQSLGKAASILLLSIHILGLLLGVVTAFSAVLFTIPTGPLTTFILVLLGIGSLIETIGLRPSPKMKGEFPWKDQNARQPPPSY